MQIHRAFKNHRVGVNGARIFCQIARERGRRPVNEGPQVVMLHAGIANSRMWEQQFWTLANSFPAMRYDRRGFGETPPVAGAFSHLEDFDALMRRLRFRRAALVGCSQGAKIALDYALTRPENVAALVLVSPALSGYTYRAEPPKEEEELLEAEEAGDLDLVNELEMRIWVDGPHRGPYSVDDYTRSVAEEMNRAALENAAKLGEELPSAVNAAGRLGEVSVPTLVVVGDLDTPRTLEAADVIAQGIAGARLEVVKGAAHLPNMERPEVFNRLVLDFLGGGSED